MKVDELIRQKAEELHRVHAHDSGRLDGLTTNARPRSRPQFGVLVGAALAVLLLFGPVAWLLRSEDPSSSLPGGDTTPTGSRGEVSVGERLFEMPGDGGLGPVMSSGSDLIVAGFDTVLRSVDGGDSWAITGSSPPGDDSLIRTEAADGILLAVGAHDGASSRLYRSADFGATWEQFELPVPLDLIHFVPGVIAHRAGEWVISGIGSEGDADPNTVYLWRSPDAVNWEIETVGDVPGRLAYSETIEGIEDGLVIISRVSSDTARDQLFAFEETTSGWIRTELTPILVAQAGLSSEPSFAQTRGAGVVEDTLHIWWSFTDGLGDIQTIATAYRNGPGEWQAESLQGVAPETVTVTGDGLVGTAHPGTDAPMLTPGFTAIVMSNDGITWSEVGRADGLFLRQLRLVSARILVAAGNQVEAGDEGFLVPSSGIWEIELSDDLASIINSR